MSHRPVALTARDRALIHAAWSLGAAPAETLRQLISPTVAAGTLRDRLRRLHQNHYLRQQRFVAPAGGLWLYSIGRASLTPHEARPWRPGLRQLEHTLAVGNAVVALTRPGFCPGIHVTGWKGEAEIRAWATPGAPFADALITWTTGSCGGAGSRGAEVTGAWHVEVDRATESRAAWRRKLVRYLNKADDLVLVLTTSTTRASHLAHLAADVGIPLLATTLAEVRDQLDPVVLDTRTRRRAPLSRSVRTPSGPVSS